MSSSARDDTDTHIMLSSRPGRSSIPALPTPTIRLHIRYFRFRRRAESGQPTITHSIPAPTDRCIVFLCIWSDGNDYRIVTAGLLNALWWIHWSPVTDSEKSMLRQFSTATRVGLGGNDDAGICLLFDDFKIARPEGECIPCQKAMHQHPLGRKTFLPETHLRWFWQRARVRCGASWEGCHCLNRSIYLD